jgi:hypothetical protein
MRFLCSNKAILEASKTKVRTNEPLAINATVKIELGLEWYMLTQNCNLAIMKKISIAVMKKCNINKSGW